MKQEYLLESGKANYADLFRQSGEFPLHPESGQVPKYENGILSAYPSPSGWEPSGVLLELGSGNPLNSGENILEYTNLLSKLSQPNRTVPPENLNYLNDYIHYYPRETISSTLYTTVVTYIPVRITALNFTRIPLVPQDRYSYTEPEEESDE